MKKTFFLFSLLFLTSSYSFAGAEGGNGGGLSEKLIFLANSYIPRYIHVFLTSQSSLPDRDRKLLEAIRDSDKFEKKSVNQIVFLSGKDKPEFFNIDGAVRVAKTGNNIGDTIFINLDLIYSKDKQGRDVPISLPMAITTLVHELGHHHGQKNHAYLDRLGTNVANTVRDKVFEVKKITKEGPLTANYLYSFGGRFPINRLMIFNRTDTLTIDEPLKTLDQVCDSHPPKNIYFTNLAWSNRNTEALIINARVLCGDDSLHKKILRLDIPYNFQESKMDFHLIPVDCENDPKLCW